MVSGKAGGLKGIGFEDEDETEVTDVEEIAGSEYTGSEAASLDFLSEFVKNESGNFSTTFTF